MNSNSQRILNTRILNALFVALCLMAAIISPASAQRSEPIDVSPARVQAADGQTVAGHHVAVDDLIIVCPFEPLAAENHPCNETNAAPIKLDPIDDYTLVCPIKEVGDPNHPCFDRGTAAGLHSTVDDFKLVCPIEKLLAPDHPCNRSDSSRIRFVIPDAYTLVCPIKKVLDPNHPCFDN